MQKTVCVFCSSSGAVDAAYIEAAGVFGQKLAERKWCLVYGGASVGSMGKVAQEAKRGGCVVAGVIPQLLHEFGITNPDLDILVVTEDMRQRKASMDDMADAFVILPGGFGTLEEALEVITLKQLGYHNNVIVFVNTNGFFDPLEHLFEHFFIHNFAKDAYRGLYHFAADADEALQYIADYQPSEPITKWTESPTEVVSTST